MNRKAQDRIKRTVRRGFTLLEIIVVVTIIALLATLVIPKVIDQVWRAKSRIAKAEVKSIAQQVSLYLLDNGMNKPSQEFDLNALVPTYLKTSDLIDPWGAPYFIVVPGEFGDAFDVVTLGGDGQVGGEGEDADINHNNLKR